MRMQRSTSLLLAGGLVAAGVAMASPAEAVSTLGTGSLSTGSSLTSPNGAYRAQLTHGRLVVRTRSGRPVWATMGNDGVLALTSSGLLVWNNRVDNTCPHTRGKTFVVDLSSQFARMCSNGNQVRATPVTTGATAKGNGTPTGSWRIYAKVRKTVLRPASGGAYPVNYWVPYDGAYGVHDSPWQKFAYGSSKYRTRGSHGCTHVPARAMAWFFQWAKVGTRVTIQR